MREYSLRPEKDYKVFTDYEVNSGGDTTSWNLIWLAVPQIDLMLDGTMKYFDEPRWVPWLEGVLWVTAKYEVGSAGKTVSEIMGDSPIRFVDEFTSTFEITSLPANHPEFSWDAVYETMRERAYLSEGRSAQYEAAKKCQNIVLLDFSLKKRTAPDIPSIRNVAMDAVQISNLSNEPPKEFNDPINRLSAAIDRVHAEQSQDRAIISQLQNRSAAQFNRLTLEVAELKNMLMVALSPTNPLSPVAQPSTSYNQVPDAQVPPSNGFFEKYIDNGDGTVTDCQTGLMWMRCAVGETWNGSDCVGEPILFSWDEAQEIKVTFACNEDWRLPTHSELMTLVDRSGGEPVINTHFFHVSNKEFGEVYWSSSAVSEDYAWATYFGFGNTECYERVEPNHVRLVRNNNARLLEDYACSNCALISQQEQSDPTDSNKRLNQPLHFASNAELVVWVAAHEQLHFSELRDRLLPLDILPNAFINDINECALDLVGEPALVEEGDNVIVQREVLLQIIAG